MKKLVLLVVMCLSLMAEMSFNQVQNLIDNKKFPEALIALEVIQANHPNESIVYFALAQAKAGAGDLIGAKSAFLKAESLNPKFTYAKPSVVEALRFAIEPKVNSVKAFERQDKHSSVLWIVFGLVAGAGVAYFLTRPKKEDEKVRTYDTPRPSTRPEPKPVYEEPKRESMYKEPEVKPTNTIYTPKDYTCQEPVREVHHYHETKSSGNTVAAGLAGVAAGVAVSSLLHESKENHYTEPSYHREPAYDRYPSRTQVDDEVDNSWKGSNSSSDDSWGGSNSDNDDSWGGSND